MIWSWKSHRIFLCLRCRNLVILHHLCGHSPPGFPSMAVVLGTVARYGEQNQLLYNLLLKDYAGCQTKRLCLQHHHIYHDQHRAACPLCKKVSARWYSWGYSSVLRGRTCLKMCLLHTISWQKETWMHLIHIAYIQYVLGYDENEMAAEEIATLAKDQCVWKKCVVACSSAEGWWLLIRVKAKQSFLQEVFFKLLMSIKGRNDEQNEYKYQLDNLVRQ